jgi:endoglucanase
MRFEYLIPVMAVSASLWLGCGSSSSSKEPPADDAGPDAELVDAGRTPDAKSPDTSTSEDSSPSAQEAAADATEPDAEASADNEAGSGSLPDADTDSAADAQGTTGAMVVDGGTGASSFHMVNWAVNGDNFQNGPLLLSGITSSSDTYAGVQAKSNLVLNAFITLLKANSVRVPINEPTATGAWWNSYKAVIDTAVAKNMKVVVGYWAYHNGKPDSVSNFYTMWSVVINAYKNNPLVYFDIHNEPYGYSSSQWIQQVKEWISMFPQAPQSQIIIAGDQWDDYVVPEGQAFPGYLLQLHIYDIGKSGPLTEGGWSQNVLNVIGSYANRTIVGEWGESIANVNYASATSNTGQSTALNLAYVVGVSNQIRDSKMGSGYWPGLWAVPGNISSWSLLNIYGSGANLTFSVQNESGGGLARVQHSWGM